MNPRHAYWTGKKRPDIADRKGTANPNWKGDKEDAPLYERASKGGSYTRNRKDWLELCRSCHMKHDYKLGIRRQYARQAK